MITSVLFDMGGTLEDIFVDAQSEWKAIETLHDMLTSYDLDPAVDLEELKRRVDEGWKRYGAYRDSCDVELKPIEIWCGYVLTEFAFPREKLTPHCEEIAHMWEVTHYHRALRPRVGEMLEGLKGEDLFNIVGTPPNLFAEIRGDAFAPRNPQALKIDFVKRPPYFEVTPTHKAKTWLLDPRAPKIEPPAAVKMLREEGL